MDFNRLASNRYVIWKHTCFAGVLLFQALFFLEAVFFYEVIVIPPHDQLSYGYWGWYLTEYTQFPYQAGIERIANGLGCLFLALFLVCLVCVPLSQKLRRAVGIRYGITVLICGLILYGAIQYYIKVQVIHYRLFMQFIPIEVLSIVLFCMVWRVRKSCYGPVSP